MMLSKRKRILHAAIISMLIAAFGVLMIDPFFRHLVFGPKYNGIPLATWQKFFREWNVIPPKNEQQQVHFLDAVHEAVISTPDPVDWKRLSGEDRRAILMTLADDPKEFVRFHVAGALGYVPATDEVVALLRRYTREDSGRVRKYAARSLGNLDPTPTESIPDLLRMAGDPDPGAAVAAQWALGSIGNRVPESVVPKLIPLIEAPNVGDAANAWVRSTSATCRSRGKRNCRRG